MTRRLSLLLVLTLLSPFASAFEYGFLQVPKAFEPLRRLLIASPHQCVKEVERKLQARASLNSENVEARSTTILLNHLASLCAFRSGQNALSMRYIDTALAMSEKQNHQAYRVRSMLVKAQLMSEDPNQASQSEEYLKQAEQAIPLMGLAKIPNVDFQLERIKANRLLNLGQLNEAKNHYLKAKELAYEHGTSVMKAWSEALLARFYLKDNQPQLALSHFNEALHLASGDSPEELLLNSLIGSEIATIYLSEGELSIARDFQRQAIESAELLDSPDLQAQYIIELGEMSLLTGEANLALSHFLNAKQVAKRSQYLDLLAKIEMRLGQTYAEMKDYEPAFVHLQTARQLYHKLDMPNLELRTLLNLGELHIQQQEFGLAVLQLRLAEKLANTIGLSSSHSKVYKLLANAFESNGNYAQALEEYKVFHTLSQQYQQIRAELRQQDNNQQYQYIEQAQQLSDLTREKALLQQQSNYQQMVLMSLGLILLCLFALHLMLRQRSARLQRQTEDLTELLQVNPQTGWQQLHHETSPITVLKQNLTGPQLDGVHHVVVLLSLDQLGDQQHSTMGRNKRLALSSQLVKYLEQHSPQKLTVGHLCSQQFLLLCELGANAPSQLADKLLKLAEQFSKQEQLSIRLSLGCCLSPFLTKTTDAVSDNGLQEIATIAAEAAGQLGAISGRSEWVELKALNNTPAAFFGTTIVSDIKQAIAKGMVKANASADKSAIKW